MTTFNDIQASDIFTTTFDALESAGVKTCILHDYEEYPNNILSDVDFIVFPDDLSKVLSTIIKLQGILVQCLQHESNAYYYVLWAISSSGVNRFLHLDVSGDYRRNGYVFLTAEEILTSRRRYKDFWIPAADVEFAYYLIKKVTKASLNEVQTNSLVSLYKKNPKGCRQYIHRFWPENSATELISAVESNKWSNVCSRIRWFRKKLFAKAIKADPSAFFLYWKNDLARRMKRLSAPTGFQVVFLGTDGSGKSSVIREVEANLSPVFRKTFRMHLRPSLLRTSKDLKMVKNPHGLANYSPIISLLKLGYFSLDYIIGYFITIYFMLVQSTLVLFDRYYHDILVDPKRYRYSGPMWLARYVGKIIPKPDLFILLDASPEILQSRKQEVSFMETDQQQKTYLKLVCGMKNGIVVDSSRSLNDVVSDVNKAILELMADRTRKRLAL
jgi:thymidylate kinase